MALISQHRLDALPDRRNDPTYRDAYQALALDVEAFLELPLGPPDTAAGYYHNFFCPDHGVQLTFDPDRPGEHACPRDDRRFSGEPYDSAWRWFVNHELSAASLKLALMWRIDADGRSKERLTGILLGYAGRYAGYESDIDRGWGRGKATYHSLDESVWLIPLVQGYDLIREDLHPTERSEIENGLMLPAAEHILEQKYNRIHNIECWHNAALAAAGVLLDREDLLRTATTDRFGFHHQLEEGVLEDGFWWEGSSSYHFYTLSALIAHALALGETDPSLSSVPRLKRMFEAPIQTALPDFRLPAGNDCWFFSSLVDTVCHGVPPASAFYEIAHGWYGDPIFAWILRENLQRRPRSSLESFIYGSDLHDSNEGFSLQSKCFPQSGLALLRSGDPLKDQSCLILNYGPHGGGHGHPDKLSISFYLQGAPIAPDLGTPGYGIALSDSWYRQTASHNTVTIDGRSQPEATGELIEFRAPDDSGFGVAAARVEWSASTYEEVEMHRAILWRPEYFVDLFQVLCSRPRQIDWICRINGERVQSSPHGSSISALKGDGYQHIQDAAGWDGSGTLRWEIGDRRLDLHLPMEEGTEVLQGRTPYQPAFESCDVLLRRRKDSETLFLAVFHGYGQQPFVTGVRAQREDSAIGLEVKTVSGLDRWILGQAPGKKIGGEFSYRFESTGR